MDDLQQVQPHEPTCPKWVKGVLNYQYSNVCFMWGNMKDIHLAFGQQLFDGDPVAGNGVTMSLAQAKLLCQDLMWILAHLESTMGEIPTEPKSQRLDS